MIYQTYHLGAGKYMFSCGENFTYYTHFHKSFELMYISSGELEATVRDKTYILGKNDYLFLFPHQLHSYKTTTTCTYHLIVFSQDIIEQFWAHTKDLLPASNMIHLEDVALDIHELTNLYLLKGFLYTFCGKFMEQATFMKKDANPDNINLIDIILSYIADNYNSSCSLKDIAELTKYDYAYLSKYFIKCIGIPFTRFVNSYRIDNACHMLITTDNTISYIANECGFGSLRSFNRVFKALKKMTAKQFRNYGQSLSYPVS